jgi:hypothetical protein
MARLQYGIISPGTDQDFTPPPTVDNYEFAPDFDYGIGNRNLDSNENYGISTVIQPRHGQSLPSAETDSYIIEFDCSSLVGKTILAAELRLYANSAYDFSAGSSRGLFVAIQEQVLDEGTDNGSAPYTGVGPTFLKKDVDSDTDWTNTGGGNNRGTDSTKSSAKSHWSAYGHVDNNRFPSSVAAGDPIYLNDSDARGSMAGPKVTGIFIAQIQECVDEESGRVAIKLSCVPPDTTSAPGIRTSEYTDHSPRLFITALTP